MTAKMKFKKGMCIFFMITIVIILHACKSTNTVTESTQHKSAPGISASGIIQPQGATTYQYGEYVLIDDNGKTLYALKSTAIQLLTYIGKRVNLKGMLIEGYPIEGGPEYLDVVTLDEIPLH